MFAAHGDSGGPMFSGNFALGTVAFIIKGAGEYATDLDDRMTDPRKREHLLDLIRLVEQERTLMGMASHLVAAAEK